MGLDKNIAVSNEIILIRHGEVDAAWKGICYGNMDVPLSEQGIADSKNFAANLGKFFQDAAIILSDSIQTHIFHSGLFRTAFLAAAIADSLGIQKSPSEFLVSDARLKERNYGLWQGQSWDSAYNSDPDHFHDLIDQPDTYRPPEGETTTQMQQRVTNWFEELSARFSGGRIVATSHSGPIAALAGYVLKLPANQWAPWIIGNLESVVIGQSSVRRLSKEGVVVDLSPIPG